MNRLTYRPDNGIDEILYLNPADPEGSYDILDLAKHIDDGDGSEAGVLIEISKRLAAYEDTGLTPEDVADLQMKISLCREKAETISPDQVPFLLYALKRACEDLVDVEAENASLRAGLARVTKERGVLKEDLCKICKAVRAIALKAGYQSTGNGCNCRDCEWDGIGWVG
jgi:hypothetical protein